MYKRKLKYKVGSFLNNYLPIFFESKSEEIFYNLAKSKGVKLRKQVHFTHNQPLFRRILYKILPFLYKGYRCDFMIGYNVIEIDSEFHNKEYDNRRDDFMQMYGFKIYRIDWKGLYNKRGRKKALKIIKELTKRET